MKTLKKALILIFLVFSSITILAESFIIAVLPFVNVTKNPEYDWIGTGIMATVTSDLQNLKEWIIVDRENLEESLKELQLSFSDLSSSAKRLKLGRFLAANTLITGDYQIIGSSILINSRFIDVETNRIIKATKVQGQNYKTELFDLQSRIAFNLVNGINEYNTVKNRTVAEITEEAKEKIEKKPTESNEAFEFYTKAKNAQKSAEYDKARIYVAIALEEDPNYFDAIILAGIVAGSTYNYAKALDFADKALKSAARLDMMDKAEAAKCYALISDVYYNQSKYNEALEYYLKALAIEKKVYGEEHHLIAFSYNNIGTVNRAMAKYDRALDYHNKALAIYRKIYSEKHFKTSTTYNEMGLALSKKGEHDKALTSYSKALSIRKELYDENHHSMATLYTNMGCEYFYKSMKNQALDNFHKALDIFRNVYGEENHYTATAYNNIGRVYASMSKHEQALENYFKTLDIFERIYGEEHSSTATVYNNIGAGYAELHNYDRAFEYHLKTLEIRKKILGERHPKTKSSYKWLSRLYRETGDSEKAQYYKNKAEQ